MRAALDAPKWPLKAACAFCHKSGIPSALRRLWPIGKWTSTRSVASPFLKKTCTALAIERFSGSR
jgi:hypothetical protein